MSLAKTAGLSSAIVLILSGQIQAEVNLPDAGQTTQQLQQKPFALPKTDTFVITAPALSANIPAGGETTEIKHIQFSGISKFTQAQLIEQALGGEAIMGKSHDLATIKGFANQVSEYYRNHRYPFARAFIPAQTIDNGILLITVVEGKYGQIITTGEDNLLNQQAQDFLSSLKTGDVIESASLERATLILSDQPGIQSRPLIQPSSEIGAGDLMVGITRDKPYAGSITIDNHGNRYTGENKVKTDLNISSPFRLGDQISLSGLYSQEQMWLGHVGYHLPLHRDGLRATISYAHTYYQLGKDFKDLGAKGTADIVNAGLSYPLVRSQKTNINLALSLQHKTLSDDPSRIDTTNTKHSRSLPVSLSFDTRDTVLGGGIVFGSLGWTKGTLVLDDALTSADKNNTAGDFDKLTLDLARMQALPNALSLYVRGSAQWSNKNLDSSEGFGIGGVTGVRAYPSGEGYGNVGWVTQTELRYALNTHFSPYAFYDIGSSTANQTTVGRNPSRDLSGLGLGLRYTRDQWSADVLGAWRLTGGTPNDQNIEDAVPRLLGSVNYHF